MSDAERLRASMHMEVSEFSGALGIKLATYKKKRADGTRLKGSYGYAVSDLEGILETARSVLPADKQDFNVARWFAAWIKQPQPALGGEPPEKFLDTPTGRVLVQRLVGAMGSGAYL